MHEEDAAPTLDAETADRLRQLALRAVVDRGTAEILGAFGRAGVPSVVLRGPAIATWLYDDPLERPYGDVDLLVQPEQLEAARGVLTERGFARAMIRATEHDHTLHDEAWLREAVFVDLHRTLSGAGAAPSVVWEVLTRDMRSLAIDGSELPVPDYPARALVVALHCAHHGVELEKPREDLRHALDRVELEVWRKAAELASEIGGTDAFSAGLRLLPAGASLAQELGLPERISVDATLRAASAPPMAIALDWLAHGPLTGRQKVAFVARKIVPPPAYLRETSHLANRGVIGLAAAYVIRVGLLAARLPVGARALSRARRDAGNAS